MSDGTLAVWPEWLGTPIVDNYAVGVVDRRIKTEMEVGSIRRVEFDTDETEVACTLRLEGLSANFFEAFERDFLIQGTTPFQIKLWIGGELKEHIAVFKERPSVVFAEWPYTEYSFTLELFERQNLMSTGLMDVLYRFGPDFLNSFSNRLHYILHTEAPRVTLTPSNIWTATNQDWEDVKKLATMEPAPAKPTIINASSGNVYIGATVVSAMIILSQIENGEDTRYHRGFICLFGDSNNFVVDNYTNIETFDIVPHYINMEKATTYYFRIAIRGAAFDFTNDFNYLNFSDVITVTTGA